MNRRTLENIMEITNLFGYYNTSGKFKECTLTVSYFDQLKDVIESWADEFEENFSKEDEYLVEITAFTERKFSEMGWILNEKTSEIHPVSSSDTALVVLSTVSESKYGTTLYTTLHENFASAEKEAERRRKEYEDEFGTEACDADYTFVSYEDLRRILGSQLSKIDLGFAILVVEKSVDPTFPEEVYIYLEEKDTGCILQDIVTVGRRYHYDDNEGDSPIFENGLSVKVWTDKDNEDYTHRFEIDPYQENDIK